MMGRAFRRGAAWLWVLLILVACRRVPAHSEVAMVDVDALVRSQIDPHGWTLLVHADGPRWLGPAWWRAQGVESEALDPASLRLTREGAPVPFLWLSAPDGAGLLFLGQTAFTPHGPAAAYQLVSEASPGSSTRVDGVPGTPATSPPGEDCQRVTVASTWYEEDLLFRSTAPLDPPFLWASLRPPETFTFPVVLTDVVSTSPVTVSVTIWGQSSMPENPDHHVRVLWDDTVVDDHFWDGEGMETWQVRLDPGAAGDHALTLAAPGGTTAPVDQMWLDGVRVTWRRALAPLGEGWQPWAAGSEPAACWSVGPGQPGATYVALLQRQDRAVEPIIWTSPPPGMALRVLQTAGDVGWIGVPWHAPPPDHVRSREVVALEALAKVEYLAIAPARLHAALAPLLAARGEEGYVPGLVTPGAVWDAAGEGLPGAEAVRHLVRALAAGGRLQYVLLVGDATPYPADLWDAEGRGAPTGWVRTMHLGYTASDAALVADDSGQPLVAVGRLPVSDPEELRALVAKTLAWQPSDRLLFFSDDEGAFANLNQQLEAFHQADAHIDVGAPASPELARQRMLAWLKEGPGTLVYVGHASMGMLGDAKYLVAEDADHWGPAVVVTWACLCANFAHPTHESLAEAWMARPQGAVAVVGPTGTTTTGEQTPMALALQQELVRGEPIGLALLRAWQAGQSQDAVYGFVLLGDPALRPMGGARASTPDAATRP